MSPFKISNVPYNLKPIFTLLIQNGFKRKQLLLFLYVHVNIIYLSFLKKIMNFSNVYKLNTFM